MSEDADASAAAAAVIDAAAVAAVTALAFVGARHTYLVGRGVGVRHMYLAGRGVGARHTYRVGRFVGQGAAVDPLLPSARPAAFVGLGVGRSVGFGVGLGVGRGVGRGLGFGVVLSVGRGVGCFAVVGFGFIGACEIQFVAVCQSLLEKYVECGRRCQCQCCCTICNRSSGEQEINLQRPETACRLLLRCTNCAVRRPACLDSDGLALCRCQLESNDHPSPCGSYCKTLAT